MNPLCLETDSRLYGLFLLNLYVYPIFFGLLEYEHLYFGL